MLKVDWLRHPAFGLGVFAAIGLTLASLGNEGIVPGCNGHQSPEQHLSDSKEYVPTIKAPARNPNPNRHEWREEKDLEAQQWMMRWAAFMFAVTTAGVWYIAQTLEATRAAVDEAKSATKAAQDAVGATREVGKIQGRAYLLVTPTARLKFQGETRKPLVQATIKNKGQTPATAIAVRADIIYPQKIGAPQISPEVISFDLAPEGDYVFEYTFPDGALPPINDDHFPLDFTVIIRVSYETAFGSTESEKFPFAIQYLKEKDLWNLNWTSRVLTEAERKRFEERKRIDI